MSNLINSNASLICKSLDFIPVVSTAANLLHIFARCYFKIDPNSSYGKYLRERDIDDHLLMGLPLVNIFYSILRMPYLGSVTETVYDFDKACLSKLNRISKVLCSDKKVVLSSITLHGSEYFNYASNELKNDPEVILAAVSKGWGLNYIPFVFRSNKSIVLAAVRHSGMALQYASEELKNDRDIVLAAVREDGMALQYASEELKNDREIILAAVGEDGRALQYAPEELKKDREIVLAAVRENGWGLKYASNELKNDRDIVLNAVRRDGIALQCASEELKHDREIVLAAVREDGFALLFASIELKHDRDIVLTAVRKDGVALQYASEALKNDPEIVEAAVRQNGNALGYASNILQADLRLRQIVESQIIEASMIRTPEEEIFLNAWRKKPLSFLEREDTAIAAFRAAKALEYEASQMTRKLRRHPRLM